MAIEVGQWTTVGHGGGGGSYPLTPTLSPGEREPRTQSVRKFHASRPNQDWRPMVIAPNAIPPLLGGEGRGEGKRGLNRAIGSILLPAPLRALLRPACRGNLWSW